MPRERRQLVVLLRSKRRQTILRAGGGSLGTFIIYQIWARGQDTGVIEMNDNVRSFRGLLINRERICTSGIERLARIHADVIISVKMRHLVQSQWYNNYLIIDTILIHISFFSAREQCSRCEVVNSRYYKNWGPETPWKFRVLIGPRMFSLFRRKVAQNSDYTTWHTHGVTFFFFFKKRGKTKWDSKLKSMIQPFGTIFIQVSLRGFSFDASNVLSHWCHYNGHVNYVITNSSRY